MPASLTKQKKCPLCRGEQSFEFLHRPAVPVHQNRLFESAGAARSIARGDLALRLCPDCGFAFNASFRPELLDYGQDYDNTQDWSSAYSRHVDGLVRSLIEEDRVCNARVVEIGCGKGAFLRKVIAYPGSRNRGLGLDPSYVGPDTDLAGRLRFERCFFDGTKELPADVVLCRHVIEHIPDPLAFLDSVRKAVPGGARAFFETPCLGWILRRQVLWDFFYEHCSLFTPAALAGAFQRVGFDDSRVRLVFGEQYLWLRARVGGAPNAASPIDAKLLASARSLGEQERHRARAWSALVRRGASGGVAVWGAGAKGVTFCNLVDPHGGQIACVIDVNPAKQGRYPAGTGHRIISPAQLRSEKIGTVLVLNPNYLAEVRAKIAELGAPLAVVDAMQEEGQQACA